MLSVKPEPGDRRMGAPPSHSRYQGEGSPTIRNTTVVPSEPRGMRSAAPSVDTRPVAPAREYHFAADQDPDDVVFMEVRRRVKPVPEDDHLNSSAATTSFMANSHAFVAIGQKLREVNNTLGTLQSLGIQHVAQLPELVLVGDQSAGKSSIMSAIAGLNLPHDTGVCTRCPIHIRSSRSVTTEWTCRISLQQDYGFLPRGTQITKDDVSADNPFPPWVKQHRVVKDFVTIRDKVESIESVLRWAQVAILNHNQNHEMYIPRDLSREDDAEALARAEAHTEAKFSPNTVALEIKGPGLPDLSFYDLPGVFVNAPHNEEQYLANVVENLTREYISHAGAIILWAVPMNNDAMVSSTFRIIREMGADKRCLGIMTKADLLPRGNHSQWMSMLQGRSHSTELGYFITSRPDKGDLNKQAAWEESFFNRRIRSQTHAETPIWPDEFADYDERCGVVRLKEYLSHKLAEEFAKNLPIIKNIIQERLHQVFTRLSKLPELPPNPELEIRKGLLDFTNLVRALLKSREFSTQWAQRAEAFRTAVLSLKPKVIVKPETAVIDLDMESAASAASSPQPKRRSAADHYSEQQTTPSKRRSNMPLMSGANGFNRVKTEEVSTSPYQFSPQGLHSSAGPVVPAIPLSLRGSGPPGKRSRTLAQIREVIVSMRQPGVPNAIPPEVHEYLSMEAVRLWDKPLAAFLSDTVQFLQKEMQGVLDRAFASLRKRLLFREARKHLNDFIKGHRETLTTQLMHVYKIETYRLYTTNEEGFNKNLDDERRILARHRHYYRWAASTGQGQGDPPKPYEKLSEEERAQEAVRMQKEAAKLGKDPHEQELEVMAYVRAYYLTAANRFIDTVSLHVASGMFPSVSESVNLYLDQKLNLIGGADQAHFDRLMEEEQKTADLRKQLKEDKKKFDEAMNCILALEKSASSTPTVDESDAEDPDDDPELHGEASDIGDYQSLSQAATGEVM